MIAHGLMGNWHIAHTTQLHSRSHDPSPEILAHSNLKIALISSKMCGASDKLDNIFFLKSENVESAGHFVGLFKSGFVYKELRDKVTFGYKTPNGDYATTLPDLNLKRPKFLLS